MAGHYRQIAMLGAGIIGGIIGGAIVLAFTLISGFGSLSEKSSFVQASDTPGMDAFDAHRCPAGQKKIEIVQGVEDGFSRAGVEPAIIRPALLDLPYYDHLYHNKRSSGGFRNFDERGVDKILMTFVEFPPKIASGIFVIRYRAEGSIATDVIQIGDKERIARRNVKPLEFNVRIPEIESGAMGILMGDVAVLNLSDFLGQKAYTGANNLQEYFLLNETSVTFDVIVQDDTRVDFIGISLCQNPLERRGATMSVDSRDFGVDGIAFVQCDSDLNQPPCDPHIGDTLCTASLPLGCYKEGNNSRPSDLLEFQAQFAGGEIKVTEPVIGEGLGSLQEANATCAASFGAGWRTLSYHEAGGGRVAARADIPPRTRMWVDVKDKPAASCWRNGPKE